MANIYWLLLIIPSIALNFNYCFAQNLTDPKIVVLDAGHGGKDPGTSGDYFHEKKLALEITLKVDSLLHFYLPSLRVEKTRGDDVFVPLHERARFANELNADLFVSIHCNANPNSDAIYGTETYIMGVGQQRSNLEVAFRENSVISKEEGFKDEYKGFEPGSALSYILMANYQIDYQEKSLLLAKSMEQHFKVHIGRPSRGVKQEGFIVLYRTYMPSVLVEVGYLTNKEEELYLSSEKGQWEVAACIYRAIRDYFYEAYHVTY